MTNAAPQKARSTPSTSASKPSPRYGEGRAALLAAAVRVVANQGLRNLTYRAVAREAGVAHGLVAHHFGTREFLLEAAMRFSLDGAMTSVSSRPGSGDLTALFEGLADLAVTEPDLLAFQYELILEARRRPELRPHVDTIYESLVDAIRHELVCAGIEPDDGLTHMLYAAADGLVFNQITHASRARTSAATAWLRRLLAQLADGRGNGEVNPRRKRKDPEPDVDTSSEVC